VTTVLFWDIDGTLLTTARAGIFAVQEAVEEVTGGACDLHGVPTTGLTDYEVMEQALKVAGCPRDPNTTQAVLAAYERRLPEALHRRRGGTMPNVPEILAHIDARDDADSFLLTGNTTRGANAKLTHYRLNSYFTGGGAFCSGPGPREEIARRALAVVAEQAARPQEPERVFVIGDTPQDIRCGNAIGARTLAVATGSYGVEELRAHSPWRVVERLPGPSSFERLVGLDAGG
jgi:phosphoglycolate phosphatase-like HAD superfamily hydrolase